MDNHRPAGPALTALLLVALSAAGCGTQRAEALDGLTAELARDALWDDGNAEFSVYDGRTRLERRERSFEAKIIVVKEDFVRQQLVKSDHGPLPGKTFEVLKMNLVRDIPTGLYTFHQMVSVFCDRQNLQPVKYAASSLESCGLVSVVAKPRDGSLQHVSHSYWDEEGDRTLMLEWPPNAAFYDALPLWLRGFDLEAPARFQIELLPTQWRNRVGTPELTRASVEFLGPDTARGGRLAVRLRRGEVEDRLWFEAENPHVLWRWEMGDGTTLVLRRTMRVPYWQRTAPEDQALLGSPQEIAAP